MPDACVVFGCNSTPNRKEGIVVHPISFYGAKDPQKRKRKKKWVDFDRLKRAHWKPKKYPALCSKHFRDEDITVKFFYLTGDNLQQRLRKDEVGVWSFQLSILGLYSSSAVSPTLHFTASNPACFVMHACKLRAFGKNDVAHQSFHTSI